MEKQNKKNTEKEQVLQIVYASEPADFESAVDLLVKSFSFVENIDLRKSMNFFVYNTPGLNCLLVKKQNDGVGLQCILNRSMDFFGVKCNIGGMSYAAIDKQYQNSEVGQLLKSA